MFARRLSPFLLSLLLGAVSVAPAAAPAGAQAATASAPARSNVPARLSSREFWALSTSLSEPAGFFRSDNLVSNEITFQHVVPSLVEGRSPGGVYLGVGPDQNFTYIAAMRPRIAFILDIRRGNMLQHLLYKAVFELSADRADFLSRLFSRPRPAGLDSTTTPAALLGAYAQATADTALFTRNMNEVTKQLVEKHGFELSPDDLRGIEYVYFAFFLEGPDLTYSFNGSTGSSYWRRMPTYGELQVQTDEAGTNHAYLGTESAYRVIRRMQLDNLIVPVVGDFAGPKALRAIGDWVREKKATVTAIYTSNVEQYLFQDALNWRKYYESIATLPLDEKSTFVRAFFNQMVIRTPNGPNGPRSVTLLCPVLTLVKAYQDGMLVSYSDVFQLSTQR